jgi:hypothetical protein
MTSKADGNSAKLRGPRGRVPELLARYGLRGVDIAEATATDKRSVRRWATQSDERRSRVDDHIRALERVCVALEELGLDPKSVGVWMREPNRYLQYRSPLQELGERHFDAVLDAVRVLEQGSYGVGIRDRETDFGRAELEDDAMADA